MADTLIPRGKSWLCEWDVSRKDVETGVPDPIPAESTVRAWLSATNKGAPLTDDVVVSLARGVLELRTDARRLWLGVLVRDAVTEALSGITTGTTIFEVLEVDGELDSRALVVAD